MADRDAHAARHQPFDERQRARNFRRERDEHDAAAGRVLAALEIVDAGRRGRAPADARRARRPPARCTDPPCGCRRWPGPAQAGEDARARGEIFKRRRDERWAGSPVTPVGAHAVERCSTRSAVRSGALKSMPPKPFTWRSNSPGNSIFMTVSSSSTLASRGRRQARRRHRDRDTPWCRRASAGSTPGAIGETVAFETGLDGLAPSARRARRRGSRATSGSERTDIEIACDGTSSTDANQPSPTCCRRHASSSVTTRYGRCVRKSAGGSLKARWPFSPMPTKATSIARPRDAHRSCRRHAAASCSPSSRWYALMPSGRISRSRR